jgi:hypothetical protein
MTEEQFKELRSIQFAQLAMLQSIEAGIRLVAQRQGAPAGQVGVNWAATRKLLDGLMNWKRRGTS